MEVAIIWAFLSLFFLFGALTERYIIPKIRSPREIVEVYDYEVE